MKTFCGSAHVPTPGNKKPRVHKQAGLLGMGKARALCQLHILDDGLNLFLGQALGQLEVDVRL
jgi:hypothetical protein